MLKKTVVSYQTPKEIVKEMDKYIIGQEEAKKVVAIAFVNRARRMRITDDSLRSEILPKNVLLSGPTGVGKTEIARRVADITGSPFFKVEMTKFTEVGYAGKDVESIIRDLVSVTVKREKDKLAKEHEMTAKRAAIKYVLQAIKDFRDGKKHKKEDKKMSNAGTDVVLVEDFTTNLTLNVGKHYDHQFLAEEIDEDKLANGDYDHFDIVIAMPKSVNKGLVGEDGEGDLFGNMSNGITAMISVIPLFGIKASKDENQVVKKMKVREALEAMADYYMAEFIDKHLVIADVLKKIEQQGVVFLDEIDKLISNKQSQSRGEVSREGVQRDLLPIIEGTIVPTKYGSVRTDHILFIAAGAFHDNKISDLMPELQGRFPVHVTLKSLTVKDFERILTDLKYNLPDKQKHLLKVYGIDVSFTKDGIRAIAEIAERMNSEIENTGARRLFSVIEKVMEEISFSGKHGSKFIIDSKYVNARTVDDFDKKIDTRKYMI